MLNNIKNTVETKPKAFINSTHAVTAFDPTTRCLGKIQELSRNYMKWTGSYKVYVDFG